QTISASEDSIIHAADIRDTINVLWANGAEGIAINGQRIVISTAVDCIVNTILINNVRLSNPYRIEAIGDQESMYSALNSDDALSSLRARKKSFSTTVHFRKLNSIQLPVYNGSLSTSIGN
ncbi:MAG TPA: DUF881 domain-containing protein, partial [bacterium]|nr:DUF881 domain-containing protein [bacterium]